MKDDISQKNTWKCDTFFKCSEKMVFPKKIVLEHDISCVIWKDGIFFFGRNMKDDLSQVIHGNMIFSAYMYKCYNYNILLLQKKIKDNLLPKNYT